MAEKDPVLVKRTLSGESDAFGELVERYGGLVYGTILEVVRRSDPVEDLVQEAFFKAYQSLPGLRQPGRFAPWLAQIARNTAVSWLRREQRRSQAEAMGLFGERREENQPDEALESGERDRLLWSALDRLPVDDRRLVVLYYLEDCSYRQIARFLDSPVATVRWRLSRSRRRLGEELGKLLSEKMRFGGPARRRLRHKVMAGLPLLFFAGSESQAAAVHPTEWRTEAAPLLLRHPVLLVCLTGSFLIHLVGLGIVVGIWASGWREGPLYVRRDSRPSIVSRLLPVRSPAPLSLRVEYLPPQTSPGPLLEIASVRGSFFEALPVPQGPCVPQKTLDPFAWSARPRPVARTRTEEVASGDPWTASLDSFAQGRLCLTALRLRGASTYRPGNVLADLARFLRDRAGIQVRIRERVYDTFLSPDLLEDPVHFLFQCEEGWKDGMVHFSDEERVRLGQYLHNGGFLFVEGNNHFLREMVGQIRTALRGEGRLFEIPVSHPVYHAFYDFERGFPGESKKDLREIPVKGWAYPVASSRDERPLGLWGIEVEGRLAVALSDLGLLRNWGPDPTFEGDFAGGRETLLKGPALAAATNLVVYALRR